MSKTDTNAKRARGRELELLTLKALGELGWLVTSQLARYVQNDSRAAFVTQQRVVKRLHARRLVTVRKDRLKRNCLVLSKPGAAQLRELIPGARWHHGHDLSIENAARQKELFDLALEEKRKGNEVLGQAGMRAWGIAAPGADAWVETPAGNFTRKVRSRQAQSLRRYSC